MTLEHARSLAAHCGNMRTTGHHEHMICVSKRREPFDGFHEKGFSCSQKVKQKLGLL
jgi:hypothetical protein